MPTGNLPRSPGHPFYERLNRVPEKAGCDAFVQGFCARFYAEWLCRSSLRPGRYFRMLLVGYFEGLHSERDIAWWVADSMSVRAFLVYDPEEAPPDHSTLSRTRRLIDEETHGRCSPGSWSYCRGEARGRTIGIDATTLEANAAMRSIVRRDMGESYAAFVRQLAEVSGVPTPTRADLARFDRKHKQKKTSNKEWMNPHCPDGKITKLKDGWTHLAYQAEAAVDLETGAVLAVTMAGDELGDTKTMDETLRMAQEEVSAVQPGAEVREVVIDKGYHSRETVLALKQAGLRSYVSEPDRGRQRWKGQAEAQKAVCGNRRRIRGMRGRRLQRQRSERVERPFAHQFETGGLRRIFVRGHPNVPKRLLVQVCGFNLGLLLRHLTGTGTPRSLQGRALAAFWARISRWNGWERLLRGFWASIRRDPSIYVPEIYHYAVSPLT